MIVISKHKRVLYFWSYRYVLPEVNTGGLRPQSRHPAPWGTGHPHSRLVLAMMDGRDEWARRRVQSRGRKVGTRTAKYRCSYFGLGVAPISFVSFCPREYSYIECRVCTTLSGKVRILCLDMYGRKIIILSDRVACNLSGLQVCS